MFPHFDWNFLLLGTKICYHKYLELLRDSELMDAMNNNRLE